MSKLLDTLRGYLGASTDHGLQARVAELEGKLEQAKELHFDLWPYLDLYELDELYQQMKLTRNEGHLGLEDVYKRARGLYGSFSRPVEKPAHVDPDGVVGPKSTPIIHMTSEVQPKWPACGVDYYPDRRYAEAHCGNGHYAVGHGDEERATTEAYRAIGRSHAAAREAGDPICDACVRMSSDMSVNEEGSTSAHID